MTDPKQSANKEVDRRTDDLSNAFDSFGVKDEAVPGEKEALDVSLVVKTGAIDEEVMEKYLRWKVGQTPRFHHYCLRNIDKKPDEMCFWIKAHLDEEVAESTRAVFVPYLVNGHWRLLIVREKSTLRYDPVDGDHADSAYMDVLLRKLGMVPSIPPWPTCSDFVDSGTFVILVIEHFMLMDPLMLTTETMFREANGFRKRLLESLQTNFQLKLDGENYFASDYPGMAVYIVPLPPLDVSCLVTPQTEIDNKTLEAFMQYDLDRPECAHFNVREPFDPAKLRALAERVKNKLNEPAVKTVYVTYCRRNKWKLYIIKDNRRIEHYDPRGHIEVDREMQVFEDALQFRRLDENHAEWPRQDSTDTGIMVIIAMRYHRRHKIPQFNKNIDSLIEFFRMPTLSILNMHYTLMLNESRYWLY